MTQTEEESRNILLGGGGKTKKTGVELEPLNVKDKGKKKEFQEIDYPIYFKHVRICETELVISFFLAENSTFVNYFILFINVLEFEEC